MSNVNIGTIPDRWREKISKANVLTRLLSHYNNELVTPLKPDQVTLGLKLIGKILPDLQSVSIEASINHSDLSRLELDAKLIALGHNPQDVWKSLDKPVIDHEVITIDQEPDEPVNDDVSHVDNDQ